MASMFSSVVQQDGPLVTFADIGEGTGKSALICHIISWAKKKYKTKNIAVTAPTGIAARNVSLSRGVGGRSIHAWAGIWTGKEDIDTLVGRVERSEAAKQRWLDVKILIIDEVSMLDGCLFDKLEYIARRIRETDDHFGGIQLVVTGDFFQLPPVPDFSRPGSTLFAFEAKSWGDCFDSGPIFLERIFRQKNQAFIRLLSAIRVGKIRPEHVAMLRVMQRPLKYEDGIEPAQLYSRRDEVESYNLTRLHQIQGRETVYKSVGAQVMLLKNIPIPGEHVNGDIGRVVEFLRIDDAIRCNIPIVGVHPKEPNSVAQVDHRLGLSDRRFDINGMWPLVLFTDGQTLLCPPQRFAVTDSKGTMQASRFQIPLILAWAISIHKSQGQTFPRVVVDLARVFEYGQMYVALSRATTPRGLEIRNLPPDLGGLKMAHPKVLRWYNTWIDDVSTS
ncbi:hypothetical protein D9611_003446 [Ephemerocybe angulata]|uniref:ATP-dependent DNA helicase n=1 Tax=Ephemerocybe angulata TaxID=980116 RepID=A0A8H5CA20_9AGAR|nr:hypothetical protein D9611_003446 [Tulosesus angulatus]